LPGPPPNPSKKIAPARRLRLVDEGRDERAACLRRGVNGDLTARAPPWKASFSPLKTEGIGRKVNRTRDAAWADVFDYIERFYNTIRRHSTIGYLSPVEFERKVELAQPPVHGTGSRPIKLPSDQRCGS
jgi:transposase InsO family protein